MGERVRGVRRGLKVACSLEWLTNEWNRSSTLTEEKSGNTGLRAISDAVCVGGR